MTLLRVATINLRNRVDRWAERRTLLVEQLLEVPPDLISLQEISFPIRQGVWLRDRLNEQLTDGGPPYVLVKKRKEGLIPGYLEGIGVLSRRPVLARDSIGLGYGGRVALRVSVELELGRVLDFVATHLHHIAEDREARLEQVMAMTGWLGDTGRAPYQVIAGDFNELPNGPAIQYMKQGYISAYAAANGWDPLATYPTLLAPAANDWCGCLDYIFVSPAVHVLEARLFLKRPAAHDSTLYPSDHVGILATIEVD